MTFPYLQPQQLQNQDRNDSSEGGATVSSGVVGNETTPVLVRPSGAPAAGQSTEGGWQVQQNVYFECRPVCLYIVV